MNCENYKLSKSRAIAIFLVILMAVFTGCAQNMAAKKDMEIPPEPKRITEISTSEDSESFNVLIKGNRLLTYMSVKQIVPLAVLLYFPDTALDNIKTNISPESEIIGSITASELTEKGHKSRIEIGLKKDVPYKAANEGTNLKISFSRPSKALSSPSLSSSGPAEKPVEKKEEKAVVESKKPAWINRIDFSSEEAGKSTIIIGTTMPVKYSIKKASPQLLQLKLLNTRLPDYRKLPIVTSRFESAVDRIIPAQTPAMKNTSMFTIELRESVPYFIEQNENTLLVHFEASTISPMPLEKAKLPSRQEVVAQAVVKPTSRETRKPVKKVVADGIITEVDDAAVEYDIDIQKRTDAYTGEKTGLDIFRQYKTKKLYIGEKIALDFYETDVKSVFRVLKEVSGKNFAIDKDVTGKVTLTLDKPVPWDQVLDLVLKMNQLDKVFEGDIIRIATAKTLKKESDLKNARLAAANKAKEQKIALEPLITEYISINYADAVDNDDEKKGILPKIKTILTENRGSVSADQRTNTIIITDVAEKINRAREIIKNLDKVTPQVIIEARIVEATTNFSREIGTQWGAEGGYDSAGSDQVYSNGNMAMNVPDSLLASTMGSIGFNFTKIGGTPFLLNAKLMASESQGDIKIISSPKILTLDNEKATISQGIKYPYVVTDAQTGIPETKYEDVELLLEVTPHATPDGRISMEIHIKKYDVGTLYEAGRSFDTKEADTKLLVDDGDTIVIGGIIKTTKSSGETGLPWLSKIPIVGWLFKSTEKEDKKEELLIFITPQIVQLEQRDLIR